MASPDPALSYAWAATLGLIQGLTEFLPVSSSGHLALANQAGYGARTTVAFDLLLHLGTLLVILQVFYRRFLALCRHTPRVAGYVVLGSVPAAAAGFLFGDTFEALRESPFAVCAALFVTAGGLVLAETRRTGTTPLADLGAPGSFTVGLGQALAIVPGVSRSGTTIAAGLVCGLDREGAIAFSFFLMVPIVLGAALLKALRHPESFTALPVGPAFCGFLVSVVSGAVALRLLIRLVRERRLRIFAIYCAVLGAGGLLYFGLLQTPGGIHDP